MKSQQYTRHQLRTSLDHNESMAFVKHPRVHSQAGSVSTSSANPILFSPILIEQADI